MFGWQGASDTRVGVPAGGTLCLGKNEHHAKNTHTVRWDRQVDGCGRVKSARNDEEGFWV